MRKPSFYLTADILLIVGDEVMLVQRKHEPFQGEWALPGGFVDPDERIPNAARRELQEETGVTSVDLQEFGTYGDPGRDPRGRTVSVVYWQRLQQKPKSVAGDDAADCRWFPLDQLPPLAFDHSLIVHDARKRLHELVAR